MYNIVFVSNTCSRLYFEDLKKVKSCEKLSASQKYFDMLIHGFQEIEECAVTCITARSIDPSNCQLNKLEPKIEIVDGVKYIYTKIVNKKIIKNINNIIQGMRTAHKVLTEDKKNNVETIFIFDPLAYDICRGVLYFANKNKKCALVTDLPNQLIAMNKSGHKRWITDRVKLRLMNTLFEKFDCFCFLVKSMNIINRNSKPYEIIEGMVYNNTKMDANYSDNNIVLYAGGLYENFGIKNLVEAFKKMPELQLHLYGEGSMVDYIKKSEKDYKNINYMGAIGLDEIFNLEKQAFLLINPRPSDGEFTKFSFPSKTLEYMSTGRPVLTTHLSGIPDEYFEYLYEITDESPEGIIQAINMVIKQDKRSLNERGALARDFVCNEKNNVCQAEKLWKFLK